MLVEAHTSHMDDPCITRMVALATVSPPSFCAVVIRCVCTAPHDRPAGSGKCSPCGCWCHTGHRHELRSSTDVRFHEVSDFVHRLHSLLSLLLSASLFFCVFLPFNDSHVVSKAFCTVCQAQNFCFDKTSPCLSSSICVFLQRRTRSLFSPSSCKRKLQASHVHLFLQLFVLLLCCFQSLPPPSSVRGVSWSEVATVPKRKSHRGLDLNLSWNSEEDIWKGWKKSGGTK